MLTHDLIWKSVDHISMQLRLTPIGLARRAGLDATILNKCERLRNGQPHWPSMSTIAKILNVAGLSLGQWGEVIEDLQRSSELSAKSSRRSMIAAASR